MTLVEMLIAMAITLLMMAAVVTVFASVSDSIRNRRASIEVNNQVSQVREVLQRDLAAVTCPAVPTQRAESNHGYIELIEGPHSDFDPSIWLRDTANDGQPDDIDGTGPLPRLDLTVSTLPSSTEGRLPGSQRVLSERFNPNPGTPLSPTPSLPEAVTDGRGLGDWDDVLAFTARNEDEPYVGRVPSIDPMEPDFRDWGSQVIQSQLAEVVWFAIENPVEPAASQTFYFGEPGYRTIYRRVLLIAPQLNFAFNIGGQVTGPGVVRVLNGAINFSDVDQALASLIAFQERYDLSVRLEWDPLLGGGRWTIVANSLADLTKRENRYEHHGYFQGQGVRRFPFTAASTGLYGGTSTNITVVTDNEWVDSVGSVEIAEFDPLYQPVGTGNAAIAYRASNNPAGQGLLAANRRLLDSDGEPTGRPFVFINQDGTPSSARAIVNEDGQIVAVINGYAPLGGARRGQDVMLTDVLAFDMRVYDPDAPLLAEISDITNDNFPGASIEPGDVGWEAFAATGLNTTAGTPLPILGRGAYVDLGYLTLHNNFRQFNGRAAFDTTRLSELVGASRFALSGATRSQLLPVAGLSTVFEPYRVYDTWSFHYENNGINEDEDDIEGGVLRPAASDTDGVVLIDEGTNGLDENAFYDDGVGGLIDAIRLGPDDPGEFETAPPYNTPLRGVQVTLRAYERDSRQVREVSVRQAFVPQ